MCDSASTLTIRAYFASLGNNWDCEITNQSVFTPHQIDRFSWTLHALCAIQTIRIPLLWFPTIEKINMMDTQTFKLDAAFNVGSWMYARKYNSKNM
jgi:hypothetical protein